MLGLQHSAHGDRVGLSFGSLEDSPLVDIVPLLGFVFLIEEALRLVAAELRGVA